MSPHASQSVAIDATHPSAVSLRKVLSEAFCAAHPQRNDIEHVSVFTTADDVTDWPEFPWLQIHDDGLSQQQLTQLDSTLLLSLNHVRLDHPMSIAMVSDDAAANVDNHDAPGGLLQRLKQKVSAHNSTFERADALLSMSCFGAAQLSSLNKSQHTMPLGVPPAYFRSQPIQRLVDHTDIDNPFMWLSVVCDQNIDTAKNIIEAVKVLRDYGACLELKLLISVGADDALIATLEREFKSESFVEFIASTSEEQLVKEYHQTDGFIWPCRSDRNYLYLLRAMASALPIISPDSQQIKKYVGDRIRHFRADDANDLADSLERSMADIHFRILGSSRNHKRAMRYTYEFAAMELFKLLQAYCNKRDAGAVLAS